MRPEIEAALCFVLWHYQGGSSPVGQPIRKMLGLSQHQHMHDHQLALAKRVNRSLSGALIDEGTKAPAAPMQEPVAVHQYRVPHCSDWYDGIPDHHDGHGPYEVRTLYTTPPAAPRVQCRRLAEGYMPCPYAEPQQPAIPAPPEAQTEAEKRAYAFGWWKAMEYVREKGVIP